MKLSDIGKLINGRNVLAIIRLAATIAVASKNPKAVLIGNAVLKILEALNKKEEKKS